MNIFGKGRLGPALFGAALAALVPGAALADIPPPPEPTPTPAEAPADPAAAKAAALAIKPTDIGIGDPNAPVTWIEYASAGCPHCADLSLIVLPALKADYLDSGKVYYVLRDFPLDNVAATATVIARCLPADKFYPFMDHVFAMQRAWHGPGATDPRGALLGYAAEHGLDEAGVEACFQRQELLDQILAVVAEADETLGVNSTPTSFIGDEKVVGVLPVEGFREVLDKALAASDEPPGMTPKPEATPEQSKPDDAAPQTP